MAVSQIVKNQQIALNKQGANLKVDGISGPLTQAAAIQYATPATTTNSSGSLGVTQYVKDFNQAMVQGGGSYGSYTASTVTPSLTSYASDYAVNNPLSTNASSVPTSSVVNTNTLGAGNTKITFPTPAVTPVPTIAPVINPVDQAATDATKQKDTSMQDYLDTLMNNQPSAADSYNKAQQQSGILQAQQQVNNLTGQLNEVVNRGQANQLSLVGQGRGIPEAIIGGQQAQIGRETAIQALPIQAQLSAAQGNLEMAKSNLDTLFKIYSDDATNAYNNRVAVKKAVYEYATAKEKTALDKQTLLETRAYDQTLALQKQAGDYAKMAFDNGQSSLGAKISTLAQNVNSPTFAQDFAKLQAQLKDPNQALDLALKQAQINSANRANQPSGETPTIKSINGVDKQWNPATGKWEDIASSSGAVDPLIVKSSANKIADIEKILGDKGSLARSAGVLRNGNLLPPGTINATRDWRATIGNVLATLTATELARIKGTGVTFGALSDGERQLVADSASVLNNGQIYSGTGENRQPTGQFKISEDLVKKELAKIQNLAEIDFKKRTGIDYQTYKADPSSIETKAADDYIINDVGNAIQTSGGGIYGNYQ